MALVIRALTELEALCKVFLTLRVFHLSVPTSQSLPSLTRYGVGQIGVKKKEEKHTFIIPLGLPCKECKTDSIRENEQEAV